MPDDMELHIYVWLQTADILRTILSLYFTTVTVHLDVVY